MKFEVRNSNSTTQPYYWRIVAAKVIAGFRPLELVSLCSVRRPSGTPSGRAGLSGYSSSAKRPWR